MREIRIGQRSTHDVQCLVCKQTFGNAAYHECPYKGIPHREKHDALEARVTALEAIVARLSPGIPSEDK